MIISEKSVVTLISSDTYREKLEEIEALSEKELKKDIEDKFYSILAFQHVSFSYPGTERKVLDDVSFSLLLSEKTALVGVNGAGKSTIIKLILRLYEPTRGKILLDGKDIKQFKREDYLRIIWGIFQDSEPLSLSVREILESELSDDELLDILSSVGLPYLKLTDYINRDNGEDGRSLSKGEKARLLIAKALVKNPPLLILDEPTSALDVEGEKKINDMLCSKEDCRGVLIVSHRLPSCRSCERIIVLENGKIVQDGTHETLISDECGLYKKLFDAQKRMFNL